MVDLYHGWPWSGRTEVLEEELSRCGGGERGHCDGGARPSYLKLKASAKIIRNKKKKSRKEEEVYQIFVQV